MSPDPQPPEELPELPDLAELHELPAAEPRPGSGSAPGTRPPLRVLDRAPRHLQVAALIVLAGSLLPWLPAQLDSGEAGPGSAPSLLTLCAKALAIAAAWLWYRQVVHDFGPKLGGVLGQLAELRLVQRKKGDEEGEKRRARPQGGAPATLEHPFPTGLHALSLVLAVVALVVAARDPRPGLLVSNGIAEVAMLGWAAFTWVHIASYERWGGFNPIFPLMFLGMLFAGTASLIRALTGEAGGTSGLFTLVGGGAVALGGGLAAYTIVEAMVQAKKEGDRKKALALEARKAARKKPQ